MSMLLRAVSGAAIYLLLTLAAFFVVRASSSTHRAQATSVNPAVDFRFPTCPTDGQRHEKAHIKLLKSIAREGGAWNKMHPRWQILEALQGFDRYTDVVGAEIGRFEDLYKHVPKRHKKILEKVNYNDNFNEARTLLKTNAKFCQQVVNYALPFYNISRAELETFIKETDDGKAKTGIRTAVSQTLKHMVRDWSPEGHAERDATFPYILDSISAHLESSLPLADGKKYEVLIPGAGLGRLPHEVARLSSSLAVTSNEWSASMNLAYRYLSSLDPSTAKPFSIHPFLESWSHARTRADLTRPVQIVPNTFTTSNLLIEGDFTTQFHTPAYFSAIATLFFIDTARNLISYFETIHTLLKPGGIWINVGPLLYGTAPLVQLSLDEVMVIVEEMGFEILETGEGEGLYNFNASTLYRHGYVVQRWVARKKSSVKGEGMLERWKGRFL